MPLHLSFLVTGLISVVMLAASSAGAGSHRYGLPPGYRMQQQQIQHQELQLRRLQRQQRLQRHQRRFSPDALHNPRP
ncbi:hypothetical protein [Synechococcus sp. RSCCF101]|uniref:hypothetical protein n=1 Tax=Synechococcus sp. RSCCF101 TaxID=2511069 RepID=UPI00177EE60E|nr:hypothetical protein [Synechococcus sp. RSCCF101]